MAYETPMAETPAPDALPTEGEATPAGPETVQLPSEMLPAGLKEGDVLRCVALGEDGGTFALEAGEVEEEGTPWEEDFRKEMSPREPTEEAM